MLDGESIKSVWTKSPLRIIFQDKGGPWTTMLYSSIHTDYSLSPKNSSFLSFSMNSELKAVCHCAAAIVHLRCMLWLFVPQFQRIINESPFFLIFSKSQNHNSLTPCGRWWWWFEDPEPKSLCRLHLWDRSSINQAKHEIMLDCVIAFLILQCSKNGRKKV